MWALPLNGVERKLLGRGHSSPHLPLLPVKTLKVSAGPGQNGVASPGQRALKVVGVTSSGNLHGLSNMETLQAQPAGHPSVREWFFSLVRGTHPASCFRSVPGSLAGDFPLDWENHLNNFGFISPTM